LHGIALMLASLHRTAFLRTVLTVIVIVDLASFFLYVADARSAAQAAGLAINSFAALLSRSVVSACVAVIGIIAAVRFTRRPGRLREGAVALGALTLLSTTHAQLFGSPWRHMYFSGLCLLGWLLGLVVSRRRGAPTDESYARIGSIALLGAAYLNGGLSKFAYGGVAWLSGMPIQGIIVAQDGLVQDSLASIYRTWVVATPAVAALFSIVTVAVELAGPLMLWGRRARLCVALGLLTMHLNIYVLTRILYWQSMVLLLLFGLAADEEGVEDCDATEAAALAFRDRQFAARVALLAVCAWFAVTHQSRRYVQSPPGAAASGTAAAGTSASAPNAAPPALPSPSPPPAASL
jgi:hypothetical protein